MRRLKSILCWLCCVCTILAGCRSRDDFKFADPCCFNAPVPPPATSIDHANVDTPRRPDVFASPPPRTVRHPGEMEKWDLSLQEAIHLALANSQVMRDLGGRVLTAPSTVATIYDPAIRETDPLFGVQSALSAFDTEFATGILWRRQDRTFNNTFIASTGSIQEIGDFQAELKKTAATGTQFAFRNITNYAGSNAITLEALDKFGIVPPAGIANVYTSTWTTQFEAEVVQPLLQGNGILFNRIAGPRSTPGNYNGVMIARINTDITLADFEAGINNLVNAVERTYWQLYLSYRDLDAKIRARDASLETWRTVQRKLQAGVADEEQEALAREQYYLFQAQVENALAGSAVSSEIVLANPGVQAVERALRELMGLPPTDGRLIRPSDEPPMTDTVFDWQQSLTEALARRVEIRRQKWVVKRRELELIASRNFLKWRLDGRGLYRWFGFGDDLLDVDGTRKTFPTGLPAPADTVTVPDNAIGNIFNGDAFQEWELGLQLNIPIGKRLGRSAVRNAEFLLARESAVLQEQELEISHQLSDAFGELDRAYATTRSAFNRRAASYQQLAAVRKKYDVGRSPLEFLVDAQRRTANADSDYYLALSDYAKAVVDIQYKRGSLLEYNGIYLAEGPWSDEAHISAAKLSRRFKPKLRNYCLWRPDPVTRGPVQNFPMAEPIGPAPAPFDPTPIDEVPGEVLPKAPEPVDAPMPKP